MAFPVLDRITGCEAGRRIEATVTLSQSEEYLADHFPSFPIMPGVIMLEALVEAAAWLMRLGGEGGGIFALREARAVRYGRVVRPGDELRVEAAIAGDRDEDPSFTGAGSVGGERAVAGKFVLRRVPLDGLDGAARASLEAFLEERRAALLGRPAGGG
ncbi:MAG: beta-hydroxyacyl-ACP dehydratase [bacterium]|nr:beta-hydroxyacyl-ACP dehydratase [bacterium]